MTTEFADHFLFNKQRMIVNKFSTMDQDIVSFFKDFTEPSELEEKFEKILKIGVIVAKTIGMVQNVDYVQKEFNSLISIIMDKIKEHFVDNSKIPPMSASAAPKNAKTKFCYSSSSVFPK
jgi:hypothetical protein